MMAEFKSQGEVPEAPEPEPEEEKGPEEDQGEGGIEVAPDAE